MCTRNRERVWKFQTQNFRIEYNVSPEDDLDLSWDVDGSVRKGIEDGKYVAFIAEVRVVHKPTGAELGSDYLGGCIYENAQQFRDHIGLRGKSGSYFLDMVRTAIHEARDTFATIHAIKLRDTNQKGEH